MHSFLKSERFAGVRLFILIICGILAVFHILAAFVDNDVSQHIGLAVFFIYVFVLVLVLWKIKAEPAHNAKGDSPREPGDAYWSSDEEFDKTNDPDPDNSHPYWIGGRFFRSKFANGVVIGGSGIGKTMARLTPALLLRPWGSYVVVDVKGEIAYITARAQREFGQNVYILDPWDVQGSLGARHCIKSSGFNPFDFIKHSGDTELIDTCASIAYFLCPDKPADKDPFWVEKSRGLLKFLLLHVITGRPESEHSFLTVYKWLRFSGDNLTNLLLEAKKNKSLDGLVSIAAEEWLGMQEAEATFAGIRANAQNATAIFESPQLRHCLSRSDFDPYALAKEGNVTVYLVVPERYLDSHAGFLRMVIGLSLKAINARPGNMVFFHLDEFPSLKRFDDVKRNFAFGRGQNISLTIYAQSVAAMKEVYGDAWEGFIANSALIQCFRGARDMATQKYFSALLGNHTVKKISRSKGYSTTKDSSTSSENINITTEKRPLLTPEEISTGDGIITIADGKKKILANIPYYKNVYEIEAYLTPEEKAALKRGEKLVDDWYEHFKKMADMPLNF